MAYRGYFIYGAGELANTTRVIDHLRGLNPTDESALQAQLAGSCGTLHVDYDDSWSGFRDLILGGGTYKIEDAPWSDYPSPEWREFMGVWVMDVQGLDTSTLTNPVTESIGDGGVSGYPRGGSRTVTFTALIVATTNAGARFGLGWLNRLLEDRAGHAQQVGLAFLPYTPEGSDADTTRTYRCFMPTVTQMPTVVDVAGLGRGQHLQSTVWRVEFAITFRDPYVYRVEQESIPLDFVTSTEPVQWVTVDQCIDSEDCKAHIIYPAGCDGTIPEIVGASPVAPECVGCLPLCDITTMVAVLPVTPNIFDTDVAVALNFVNTGTKAQSLTFYIRRVAHVSRAAFGDFPDACRRIGEGRVNGLEAGHRVAITPAARRASIYQGWDSIASPQAGVLTALTGAPYRLPVVNTDTADGYTWELVLETAPGDSWVVEASTYRRSA